MSETQHARPFVEQFCQGAGLDLGCGDDRIVPWAIGVDRRQLGQTHCICDLRLIVSVFERDSLDFCYSSHALEDLQNTELELRCWLGMVKHGGHLILFLPDEQRYRAHCKENGTLPNQDHKHEYFSMDYVRQCLANINIVPKDIVMAKEPVGVYSFILVIRKP